MLKVLKFGGTSVGSIERIKAAALKIAACRDAELSDKQGANTKEKGAKGKGTGLTDTDQSAKQYNDIVVIASAMGKETDELLALASDVSIAPNPRELDALVSLGERKSCALLAMALNDLGVKAISITGERAGIITSSKHTNAKILHIDTDYIKSLLKEGYVVIVAGFQGISLKGEVTTLGRGGSDLSAVALAGALDAERCEIYTDVDGVYTTDPRVCKEASKLDAISYEEMLELASMGAKVLLNRSVELAKRLELAIETKSSFSNAKGTMIVDAMRIAERASVSGIALDTDQVRVHAILRAPSLKEQGFLAKVLYAIYEADIEVDMINESVVEGRMGVDFTIAHGSISALREVLERFSEHFSHHIHAEPTSKVSIVGVGIKSHAYPAAIALSTLTKLNIPIHMISTSEIKLSLLISSNDAINAINALHIAYGLGKKI